MNKELEEWIKENDPYKWAFQYNHHKEMEWCLLWEEGATAMAEHLLSNSEKENDCKMNPKRWRAAEFESYWYIDSLLEVWGCTENNSPSDNARYAIGNYFKTEEAAKAMAEEIKKVLNQ